MQKGLRDSAHKLHPEQESPLLAGKLQQRDPVVRLVRRETRPGLRVETDNLLPPQITDGLEKLKALVVNDLNLTWKAQKAPAVPFPPD